MCTNDDREGGAFEETIECRGTGREGEGVEGERREGEEERRGGMREEEEKEEGSG